ncbi:MAG: hypothetical protein ACO2O4_03325 [Minisyncoccia bacterium]|jgi:hypothetical protein
MKIILLFITLLITGIFVSKFLIFTPKQIPEKSLRKITSAELENVAKVHIHEIYDEYKKDTESATKKWIGQKIVTIGFASIRHDKNELVIYPSFYVVRDIGILASCPWKDKKLFEKIRYGDNFIAISGRIDKMGIFEGSTSEGFPPIAFGPPQYFKFFDLGLKDCNLIDKNQIRELKANFSKENWTLEIENYGYSLEVWLRKVEEVPGELNRWKIFSMNPFERKIKLDVKESILGGFKRPDDYVLEIINGESTIENQKVLKSWKLKIP